MDNSPTIEPDKATCPSANRGCYCRPILRWVQRLLAIIGLFVILACLTPIIDHVYPVLDRRSALSHADYIVVLGGDPYRVLEGVQLLKERYAPKLIVSNFESAADAMRDQAIAWGAPPDQVIADRQSHTTAEHPAGVAACANIDRANNSCIIVTSYLHMARSKACFEKAGYKHLIMCEPRWESTPRVPQSIKTRMKVLPSLIYEAAAWVEYKVRGYL